MSLDVTLTYTETKTTEESHCQNITHNLCYMATEAGIYDVVWRPEENDIETASQLIAPLTVAIKKMKADPARFMAFDSDNGWGTYKDFLPWLEEYLAACVAHPDATVEASR